MFVCSFEVDDPEFKKITDVFEGQVHELESGMMADYIPAFRHVYKVYNYIITKKGASHASVTGALSPSVLKKHTGSGHT